MKKLFLALALVVSVASFSQIELIEQSTPVITSRISHVYLEKVGDVEYNFFYKNMNTASHEYVKFSFKTINDSYNLLYKIIMDGFKAAPRDPLKIKANGEVVWLKYFKGDDGVTVLKIQQYIDGNKENEPNEEDVIDSIGSEMTVSRSLTEEDITNLFQK